MKNNKNAVALLLEKAMEELKAEELNLRKSLNSTTEDLKKAAYKFNAFYELYLALETFVYDKNGNPLNTKATILLDLDKPLASAFCNLELLTIKHDPAIQNRIEELHDNIVDGEENVVELNKIVAT